MRASLEDAHEGKKRNLPRHLRVYRKAHEELAPEFSLSPEEQLAQRMETTQSVIARLEGGRTRPSTQTLQRLVNATGTRLKITFEPFAARP